MENGTEMRTVETEPLEIVQHIETFTTEEEPLYPARFGQRINGFALIRLDQKPLSCDLRIASLCDYAVWLIKWGSSPGETYELKLCDLHRRALAKLLAYPEAKATAVMGAQQSASRMHAEKDARLASLESAVADRSERVGALERHETNLAITIEAVRQRLGALEDDNERLKHRSEVQGDKIDDLHGRFAPLDGAQRRHQHGCVCISCKYDRRTLNVGRDRSLNSEELLEILARRHALSRLEALGVEVEATHRKEDNDE